MFRRGSLIDLVVIEAPGKKSVFRLLFRDLGLEVDIFATGGFLYDLAPLDYGFRAENDLSRWVARDPILIDNLRDKAASSNRVLVITDPDREGDLIAAHVASSVGNTECLRIRLFGLTVASLRLALSQASVTDPVDEKKAVFRHFVDRAIGFGFGRVKDKNYSLPVGRVISPCLALLREVDSIVACVENIFDAGDGLPTFSCRIEVGGSQEPFLLNIEKAVKAASCRLSSALICREPLAPKEHSPWNLNDLLSHAPRILDASISEIYAASQDGYEEGLISYIRTSSRELSSLSIPYLERLCQSELPGVSWQPEVAGKTSKEAHPSLGPLCHVDFTPSSGNLKARVLSLIAARAIESGIKVKTWRETIEVSVAELPEEHRKTLARMSIEKLVWSRTLRNMGQGNIVSAPSEVDPCPLFSTVKYAPETSNVRRVGHDHIILNSLITGQLGRPGSLVRHIGRLGKWVDDSGRLSPKGAQILKHADDSLPLITKLDTVWKLNDVLDNPPAGSAKDLYAVEAILGVALLTDNQGLEFERR